jgi:DnaK suppressor protein
MSPNELTRFRATLETMLSQLIGGSRDREALNVDTASDEMDRIQHAGEREFTIRNLERDSTRIRAIREALASIEQGTFGVCTVCDEEIAPRRLAAVPWTPCCIRCQEKADRQLQSPDSVDFLADSVAA